MLFMFCWYYKMYNCSLLQRNSLTTTGQVTSGYGGAICVLQLATHYMAALLLCNLYLHRCICARRGACCVHARAHKLAGQIIEQDFRGITESLDTRSRSFALLSCRTLAATYTVHQLPCLGTRWRRSPLI